MGGLAQTVDATVRLETIRDIPLPDEAAVVEAEIERVFGGGGSTAEIDIILDDLLEYEQRVALKRTVRPGLVDVEDEFDEFDRPEYLEDVFINREHDRNRRPIVQPEHRNELDLTMKVDIEVYNSHTDETVNERVFTGTVTKIEENHERIVTLHALDRRVQLNRNSVFKEADKGANIFYLLRFVLEDMGLEEGEDFHFHNQDLVSWEHRLLDDAHTWGYDYHITTYEFIQDLCHEAGLTMLIDRYNQLWFTPDPTINDGEWTHDLPIHWGQSRDGTINPEDGLILPPIVEWTNSEDENKTNVVAETSYDETGIGIYSVVGEERLNTVRGGGDSYIDEEDITDSYKKNNVISRASVEQYSDSMHFSEDLMRDSGTIRVVGDPRLKPYDNIVIDEQKTNEFSPISHGNYMTKTVRHILSTQEGFVTEIELGDNPRELFEQFTQSHARDRPARRNQEEDDPSFTSEFLSNAKAIAKFW